jgi:hypothetical protein
MSGCVLFFTVICSDDIICDFATITKLMQFANASTYKTFVQQYLIPFDQVLMQVLMHSKLGGSISFRWVEYASFTLSKLLNHSKVEVYTASYLQIV